MLPQDRWPEQLHGTYSRASVERFLQEAEAARQRAEALLDVAYQRRRLLDEQLAAIADRNAALSRELAHTAREVESNRQSNASAVAVVLAAAEAEAAAVIARARDVATMIRAGHAGAAASSTLALVPSEDGPTPTEPPLLVG